MELLKNVLISKRDTKNKIFFIAPPKKAKFSGHLVPKIKNAAVYFDNKEVIQEEVEGLFSVSRPFWLFKRVTSKIIAKDHEFTLIMILSKLSQ